MQDPTQAKDGLNRAQEHAAAGRWSEAARAYEGALAAHPEDAATRTELGVAYERLGRAQAAEEAYREALRQDPALLEAHAHLGRLYRAQGREAEAQLAFQRYLTANPPPDGWARVAALLAESAEDPALVCGRCACVSTHVEAFQRAGRRRLCPRCLQEQRWVSLARGNRFSLAVILAALLLTHLVPVFGLQYVWSNLALAFVLLIPLIALHELCHAGAAWLMGGRLLVLHFGGGPKFWEGRVGDTRIVLHRYPVGGSSQIVFPERGFIRARHAFMIAAGPLLHLALLALALPGFEHNRLATAYAPRESFVLINAFLLLGNLLPLRIQGTGGANTTDGGHLLRTLLDPRHAETLHVGALAMESTRAFGEKRYRDALEVAQAGLKRYPENEALQGLRAAALIGLERLSEALPQLEALAESDEPQLELRAVFLNNAAWAALLTGDLAKAQPYARQAFGLTPWMPHIQGTWGGVLIETGALEAGIHHVLQAAERHEEPQNQATNLAYAAIGFQRLGETQQAEAHLARALALDPEAPVVERARGEIAEGAGSEAARA